MTPRRRHKARTKAGEGGGLLLLWAGSNARRNKAKGERSSSAACWDGGGGGGGAWGGGGGGGEASIRLECASWQVEEITLAEAGENQDVCCCLCGGGRD